MQAGHCLRILISKKVLLIFRKVISISESFYSILDQYYLTPKLLMATIRTFINIKKNRAKLFNSLPLRIYASIMLAQIQVRKKKLKLVCKWRHTKLIVLCTKFYCQNERRYFINIKKFWSKSLSNSNKVVVVTLDRHRTRSNFSNLSILKLKTLLKWGKPH